MFLQDGRALKLYAVQSIINLVFNWWPRSSKLAVQWLRGAGSVQMDMKKL